MSLRCQWSCREIVGTHQSLNPHRYLHTIPPLALMHTRAQHKRTHSRSVIAVSVVWPAGGAKEEVTTHWAPCVLGQLAVISPKLPLTYEQRGRRFSSIPLQRSEKSSLNIFVLRVWQHFFITRYFKSYGLNKMDRGQGVSDVVSIDVVEFRKSWVAAVFRNSSLRWSLASCRRPTGYCDIHRGCQHSYMLHY